MKKLFIPYKEALALKKLGFDEPCFAYYNKEVNWNLCWKSSSVEPYNHNDITKYDSLSAPTYSQAFRWFREKYNLFGCIDLHPSTPIHWYIRIDDVIENDYIYHSEDEGLKFGTYEMGELACLIKLIEIVETK